jgi:hypothetical protein
MPLAGFEPAIPASEQPQTPPKENKLIIIIIIIDVINDNMIL